MSPGDINHGQRAHADLPPSSADKWLKCWGWMKTVAAHREIYGPSSSSAAADQGTAAHERLEELLQSLPRYVDLRPDSPPSDFGEHEFDEDLQEIFEWIQDQPGVLYSETKVDFGARFGYVGLTGTVDIILDEPTRLTLPDLKFGRGLVEVEKNPQLMTYLSGAVDRFGPRPNYSLFILQPRAYHPLGPIRKYDVSHDELVVFQSELLDAIEANYGNGECNPGDHCRKYCPALPSCRAARQHSRRRFQTAGEDE